MTADEVWRLLMRVPMNHHICRELFGLGATGTRTASAELCDHLARLINERFAPVPPVVAGLPAGYEATVVSGRLYLAGDAAHSRVAVRACEQAGWKWAGVSWPSPGEDCVTFRAWFVRAPLVREACHRCGSHLGPGTGCLVPPVCNVCLEVEGRG